MGLDICHALAVNLCSFGLIGRTSAITFQVVGHMKTCLVLVGGYMLFPAKLQSKSGPSGAVFPNEKGNGPGALPGAAA